MTINEKNLRQVDLNLLVVFMVVFRERSVSRAAQHLSVGQPAVSGSLVRLRERFGDPLFFRSGKGIKPTHKAVEIAAALAPAMSIIDAVVSGFSTHAVGLV
jgi:DNA-binding transcriptional LysR family regulator